MGVTAPPSTPPSAAAPGAAPPEALAPKLRGVQLGLRKDLQVARHLFRGEVTYTVRDPVSFETHAFSAGDYAILVAISSERTLGETFEALRTAGVVEAGEEERFYKFVVTLHRSGLLALPISDDKGLYARYERREASRRKARLLAALYLKIPLWNPDEFLVRTLAVGSRLFTRTAVALWACLMCAAAVALIGRWRDIGADLPALLEGEQVLTMWVLLMGLKAVHEFGHAYACRTFGGAVPEMGVSLILLTPCAYVDASASWSFTRIRDRVIVCLGGVYFESWIAATAAIVWAFTEQSAVHSIAYQTLVLASITTIGFNMNPLMRFDGYFILSDLLQVPNLRAQANAFAQRLLKRVFVGVDPGGPAWSLRMQVTLVAFAVASFAYRIVIVLSMCAVIALKFFAVGILLGALYGGMTLFGALYRSVRYLAIDKETQPVRRRAIVMAAALLVVPALALSIPVPRSLAMKAIVRRAEERTVTSLAPGVIAGMPMLTSSAVAPGGVLVSLESPELDGALDEARAATHAARVAMDIAASKDPTEEALAREEWEVAAGRLADAERGRDELAVRSPIPGEVSPLLMRTDLGRKVEAGTPVAIVGGGGWVARALVDQVDLASMQSEVGTPVELRLLGESGQRLAGRIVSVAPAGAARIGDDLHALTGLAGGDVPVAPTTATAPDARYELTVAIEPPGDGALLRGQRVALRLPAKRMSLATDWYRALLRFRERLAAAE